MKEYIERKRLFDALADYWNIPRDWDGGIVQPCEDALAFIENAPAADVVERKRGEWEHLDNDWFDLWRCTACGDEWTFEYDPTSADTKVNFCPNCGADMREVQT